MTASSIQKGTIVRLRNQAIVTGFRAAELVAPQVGARVADRLWCTVPRARRRVEPPAGGTSFETTALGRLVRGRAWGKGPVVYLVHGWGGEHAQLGAFVDPLVASGHRVVGFDGLAHGWSDPGAGGVGQSNAIELARSLEAVAARFGPAQAVVAHSLGALATLLALRDGWLATRRLAMVAPMASVAAALRDFERLLGYGPRTRRALDLRWRRRFGIDVRSLELALVARHVNGPELLVVHDRGDRETAYDETARFVEGWPKARLLTTQGLGHHRILSDPQVVRAVASFIAAGALADGRPVERSAPLPH